MLTPEQRKKDQTKLLSFLMRLCAFFLYKSKLRPVKEPDLRLLLLLVIDKDTLVLVSKSPRKSKLPSRVLFLMPRFILSQSEEDIGVQESVVYIPSHAK